MVKPKRVSIAKLNGKIISEVLQGTPYLVTRHRRAEAVLLRSPTTEDEVERLHEILQRMLAERNSQ